MMMSVKHIEVTSRTNEGCALSSCNIGTHIERINENATESFGDKSGVGSDENFERDVDHSLLDLSKSDARKDSIGDFVLGKQSTEGRQLGSTLGNEKIETLPSPVKLTGKENYSHQYEKPTPFNASDSGIPIHHQESEPSQLANKHATVYRFDTHSLCTCGSNPYNKETATAVQVPLISDDSRTHNAISHGSPLSGTDGNSVGAQIRSVTGSNSVVKPPSRNTQRLLSAEKRDPKVTLCKSSCLSEPTAVTDEDSLNISTQLSSSTKPTGYDFRKLSLFDEAGRMGNIPPKRAETVKDTKEEIRGKHLVTTPSTNSDNKADVEIVENKSTSHTIPEVVISDVSMEQERKRLQAGGDESINNVIDRNELDRDEAQLRPLRSNDSAYSSDSRCTSMDSGNDCISRAEEGYFADISTQLYPPTPSQELKGSGSSSSSSSSPSHHTATPAFGSEQTLRVMSDFGLQRKLSSSSGSSFRSSLSFEESEDDMINSDNEVQRKAQSSWTKIRRMVIWSPFMQSFKKKYPWVQLAGHAGNFQPGEEGCILKKYCQREAECLSQLTKDEHLGPYAPDYHGVVDKEGERYTRMQDLLLAFDCPSVMDCKMGLRTYLEDELVKAKIKPRLRHDMYKKMTEISPDEPTPEEHEQKAVTKPRYMQWREHVSSSSNLGFRIEGIKKGNKEPSKDYKLTKTKEQVKSAFKYFIDDKKEVLEKYIARLKDVRDAAEKSDFFMSHEKRFVALVSWYSIFAFPCHLYVHVGDNYRQKYIYDYLEFAQFGIKFETLKTRQLVKVIGSSLLFVHDQTGHASLWMIDFGKTTKLPGDDRLTHRKNWVEGNREDGYLLGMDNLISIFEEISIELEEQPTTKPTTTPSNTTDANATVSWALSSQSSGESFEQYPLDSPSLTVSDSSYDYTATPQKPQLKRQVATSEPKENATTNGELNRGDDGLKSVNVTDSPDTNSPETS